MENHKGIAVNDPAEETWRDNTAMILIDIIIGSMVMLYAIINSLKMANITRLTSYKRLCEIWAFFVVTFNIALLYNEYALITHAYESFSGMLLSNVFLLGAISIALSTKLGYRSVETLIDSGEKQKKAYEEAKELDGAKSSVLSVVSHEFRTPITIAKGAIELAMGEPNPDERRELLIRGRDALVRLNKLVGGLIDFAKMERVRLRMEKVDISGVIDYAAKEASPMAEGRQVVIETEVKGSPVVEGDEEALNKVVYALLDNAVKFNKRGGVVKVAAVSSDNMVRLRVEDTGIGIPREELGKIFQPLYQVDASTTRKYPGIGMGLAIVFNLVRAHGGRILVESDPGRGSRFTLLLPANRQKSLTPSH